MTELFGFDRLAHALHTGSSGIKTGSTSRSAGYTHLFNRNTGRTACGRPAGRMVVALVPANVTEDTWPVRIALCPSCQKKVN